MRSDVLFELGCEELPSALVLSLAKALAEGLQLALEKAGIAYQDLQYYATPRRLALIITAVASKQPSKRLQRKGPSFAAAYDSEGKPSKALLGFASSCQAPLEALCQIETEKGHWIVYDYEDKGQNTEALLPRFFQEALDALPLPKPMRWGEGLYSFARPVHWLVLLWDGKPVPAEILGLSVSNQSFGHRFHAPEAFKLDTAKGYEEALAKVKVIASFEKRRALIKEQIQTLAEAQGASPVLTADLLDEVTAIVEWPQALLIPFDPAFLKIPSPVLIASMQSHQKCFALKDLKGELLPYCITVANIESQSPEQVIAGNAKVIGARLKDAAFFYEQDQKERLSSYVPATEKVIFQEKLGSLKDKAKRLASLMTFLTPYLKLDRDEALRLALLSKCDLLTSMVREFPELQGTMGYYYAKAEKESEALATAIEEQYLPRFSGDVLPQTALGLALSLADRLDTLVGLFSTGQIPSGDKDPFKLRRHALALVRILAKLPVKLYLKQLIEAAVQAYIQENKLSTFLGQYKAGRLEEEVQAFILDRLPAYYQQQSYSLELIQAVVARQNQWLYDTERRLQALQQFMRWPEAKSLSLAAKRVNQLLKHAGFSKEKKGNIEDQVNFASLEEKAERTLYTQIQNLEAELKLLYAKADYPSILKALASLSESIDVFFAEVMVMVEDKALRENRLSLIHYLQGLLQGIADLSLLPFEAELVSS